MKFIYYLKDVIKQIIFDDIDIYSLRLSLIFIFLVCGGILGPLFWILFGKTENNLIKFILITGAVSILVAIFITAFLEWFEEYSRMQRTIKSMKSKGQIIEE